LQNSFHQTVLVYLPSALLLLLTPLELYFTKKSRSRDVPWSLLNATRSILTVALIILPILDLSYVVKQNVSGEGKIQQFSFRKENSDQSFHPGASPVHLVASIVKILSFIWALGLHFLCMRNGLVTSGVLVNL